MRCACAHVSSKQRRWALMLLALLLSCCCCRCPCCHAAATGTAPAASVARGGHHHLARLADRKASDRLVKASDHLRGTQTATACTQLSVWVPVHCMRTWACCGRGRCHACTSAARAIVHCATAHHAAANLKLERRAALLAGAVEDGSVVKGPRVVDLVVLGVLHGVISSSHTA